MRVCIVPQVRVALWRYNTVSNEPQNIDNQQHASGGSSIQSGRDTIQAGGNVTQTGGDYVGHDKITHNYYTVSSQNEHERQSSDAILRFEDALINVLRIGRDLARDLTTAFGRVNFQNDAIACGAHGLTHELANTSTSARILPFASDLASDLAHARDLASDLASELDCIRNLQKIRTCARELFDVIQNVAEAKLGAEQSEVVAFKKSVAEFVERKRR
jgi:hypothetical protein